MNKKTKEKERHLIGLLEFIAEQVVNLSDSLANINKNPEKIADGEQRLIKMAVDKEMEVVADGVTKDTERQKNENENNK